MLSDAMNDLQEQVKVEHVPAEKNEQGVAVSKRDYVSEYRDLARRWNLPTPGLSVHQVHRHLSQTGDVLRLNCASAETHFHQTGARVNNHAYLRNEERPRAV